MKMRIHFLSEYRNKSPLVYNEGKNLTSFTRSIPKGPFPPSQDVSACFPLLLMYRCPTCLQVQLRVKLSNNWTELINYHPHLPCLSPHAFTVLICFHHQQFPVRLCFICTANLKSLSPWKICPCLIISYLNKSAVSLH